MPRSTIQQVKGNSLHEARYLPVDPFVSVLAGNSTVSFLLPLITSNVLVGPFAAGDAKTSGGGGGAMTACEGCATGAVVCCRGAVRATGLTAVTGGGA